MRFSIANGRSVGARANSGRRVVSHARSMVLKPKLRTLPAHLSTDSDQHTSTTSRRPLGLHLEPNVPVKQAQTGRGSRLEARFRRLMRSWVLFHERLALE